MNGTKIIAVVVTYRRTEILRQALQRLSAQTRPLDGVVVVDNASGGGTGEMMASEFPEITYLAMPENLGAPEGYTTGMRHALAQGADWTWVFNDDNFAQPRALEACLAVVEKRPYGTIGIVAPRHQIGDRLQGGYRWRWGPTSLDGPDEVPHPADLVLLGAALISRGTIESIGYPRGDYFIGFWEWEYCLRARRAGVEIWVAPYTGVINLAAGSTGSSPPWRLYYQTRNHLRTVVERGSIVEAIWWMVRQLKMVLAILLHRGQKWSRLRMRFLGGWHGLTGKMGRTIEPVDA